MARDTMTAQEALQAQIASMVRTMRRQRIALAFCGIMAVIVAVRGWY